MPSTQRAPRNTLTLNIIVSTALKLIEKDGMVGLSMRQLAAELQVTATALYHHVKDKDELLEHCAEGILAKLAPHDTRQPWSAQLRSLILSFQKVFLRYPGLARYLLIHRDSSIASLQWVESILSVMLTAGYTPAVAAEVVLSMTFLINPLTLIDGRLPEKSSRAMIARSRVSAAVKKFPGRFPALQEALPVLAQNAYGNLFELALDRVIAGIEQSLHDKGESARAVPTPALTSQAT